MKPITIRCPGHKQTNILCASISCQKNPVKCSEQNCHKCQKDHQQCMKNINVNFIHNILQKLKNSAEKEYRLKDTGDKFFKKTQEGLNRIKKYFNESSKFHQWCMPKNQLKILQLDFNKATGQSINQFIQRKHDLIKVKHQYIFPIVIKQKLMKIEDELTYFTRNIDKLIQINQNLAQIDKRVQIIEQQQDRQIQGNHATLLIKDYHLLNQQRSMRNSMEEYELLPQEKKIFTDLHSRMFNAIFFELKRNNKQNSQKALQNVQILEDSIQSQALNMEHYQKIKEQFQQIRAEVFYPSSLNRDDPVSLYRLQKALQYYESHPNINQKELRIIINIKEIQKSHDYYLQRLLQLQKLLRAKQQCSNQQLILCLQKIRNQLSLKKQLELQNTYDLQIVRLSKQQPQINRQKILQLLQKISRYYEQKKMYADVLMKDEQILKLYESQRNQNIITFLKIIQKKRKLFQIKLIIQADKKQCSDLAYESARRCQIYIESSQQNVDKGQLKIRHEFKKNMQKHQIYFATKYLQLVRYHDIEDNNQQRQKYKQIMEKVIVPAINSGEKIYSAYYWRAKYAYQIEDQNTQQYLQQALKIYPDSQFFYLLSEKYYERFQQSSFIKAIQSLNKCLTIDPQLSNAALLRAKCNLQLQNYKECIKDLEKIIQIPQHKTDINLSYLGQCYESQLTQLLTEKKNNLNIQNYQQHSNKIQIVSRQALELYDQSLQLNKLNLESIIGKTRLLIVLKRYQDAHQMLNEDIVQSFSDDQDKSVIFSMIARIYQAEIDQQIKQQQYKNYDLLDEALKYYQKAANITDQYRQDVDRIQRALDS